MATDTRKDPFRGFNFLVEIDGVTSASFSEVSGVAADGDTVEYREGTDAINSVRKLPGLRKFTNIVCKRGYTTNDDLWRWYQRIYDGQDDRRDGTITLLNEERKAVMHWNFTKAWPNKILGPSLKATGNEVAIEEMELVHETLSFEREPA